MDRARVLCPSISLAAHAAFAGVLLLAPLLVTDRLPSVLHADGFGVQPLDRTTIASLGGAPAGGGPRRPVPVRVEPRPSRPVVPIPAAGAVPPAQQIDLGGGTGIAGLDDLPPGDGPGGLCLVNCGSGPDGDALGRVAVFPDLDPPAPVRAGQGGVVREPRKIRQVTPVYPALAIAARVQGRVVLDCVIDREGRIGSLSVLSGNPLLEAAAVEAVRQWRYTPTLLDGSPVAVVLTVTVEFTLR